jgi:hypothetical protein
VDKSELAALQRENQELKIDIGKVNSANQALLKAQKNVPQQERDVFAKNVQVQRQPLNSDEVRQFITEIQQESSRNLEAKIKEIVQLRQELLKEQQKSSALQEKSA